MIMTAALLAAGFTAGLYYSRGKADPVQAAKFDLRRCARVCWKGLKGAAVKAGGMAKNAWRDWEAGRKSSGENAGKCG